MSAPFVIAGPEHWASYLVNGDASGLEPDDRAKADAWLAREGVRVVSATEDEARFTWHYAMYAPECGCVGGSVIDYVCEAR